MTEDDVSAEDDAKWVASQKAYVEEYLRHENVAHLSVAEWPDFYVSPYLALWAVQSKESPGQIGWWAISGDVPTDYISSVSAKNPRAALYEIVARWTKISSEMLKGKQSPDYKLGSPEDWPQLGELLAQRVKILQSFADDEEFWAEQ